MPEEETKEKVYQVVEVPTEFGRAIKTPKGEIIYSDQLLVEIANKVDKIQKAIG